MLDTPERVLRGIFSVIIIVESDTESQEEACGLQSTPVHLWYLFYRKKRNVYDSIILIFYENILFGRERMVQRKIEIAIVCVCGLAIVCVDV